MIPFRMVSAIRKAIRLSAASSACVCLAGAVSDIQRWRRFREVLVPLGTLDEVERVLKTEDRQSRHDPLGVVGANDGDRQASTPSLLDVVDDARARLQLTHEFHF